jgi:hypothetical protein
MIITNPKLGFVFLNVNKNYLHLRSNRSNMIGLRMSIFFVYFLRAKHAFIFNKKECYIDNKLFCFAKSRCFFYIAFMCLVCVCILCVITLRVTLHRQCLPSKYTLTIYNKY